jgi:hypothetical protein
VRADPWTELRRADAGEPPGGDYVRGLRIPKSRARRRLINSTQNYNRNGHAATAPIDCKAIQRADETYLWARDSTTEL